jgi:hypothetical protein
MSEIAEIEKLRPVIRGKDNIRGITDKIQLTGGF